MWDVCAFSSHRLLSCVTTFFGGTFVRTYVLHLTVSARLLHYLPDTPVSQAGGGILDVRKIAVAIASELWN